MEGDTTMRILTSILCILMLSGVTSAQKKKFLVSPNQEVIPMNKESAEKIMQQYNAERRKSMLAGCVGKPIYGFDPDRFPVGSYYGFYHKDVCGEWFVIPASGTIDTFYFQTYENVGPARSVPGSMDSTVIFRIFQSFITPTHGPGIRPGPYRPPCTSWGYWVNTNDDDQGVAAFREDATDTTWIATNLLFGDAAPSFPPFGASLWGLQGYPIPNIKPNTLIKVAMEDLSTLNVTKGDVIFVSFKIPSAYHISAPNDIWFQIYASDNTSPYPSRDWKFYEHDSGPSTCAGIDRTQIKRGWVPRGPSDPSDTLNTTAYNIWYAMSPSENTPPQISGVERLDMTTSSEPRVFLCNILDCDAENPGFAGIRHAMVKYSLDTGKTWITDYLQNDGNDQFEYALPGVQPTRMVYYKVVADDSSGATDSSGIYSYKVVTIEDPGWYRTDTISTCLSGKLGTDSHSIDTAQWFVPPRGYLNPNGVPHSGDDGTAGPFSIGDGFVFYGDTMHYAWIGVNGAMALSKTSDDTIDVNSTGFATNDWDFPFTQHHSRSDTVNEDYMPKAFIAPFWADWLTKQDSPVATFGHVRYKDDADKFVAEWDSIGNWNSETGLGIFDIEIFRVILNKTDYSIEFQYDDVGMGGLDTLALVGIQCDSNYHPMPAGQFPPFAYYNKNTYPRSTRLHSGLCIRYIPVIGLMATGDGWNLLSVAGAYQNNNREFLFPTAISQAFAYQGGYVVSPVMENGQGYWLKFSGPQTQQIIGRALSHMDIPVKTSWNLVGSISAPVPIANITADPPTHIGPGSVFYYYTSPGGYQVESSIRPGVGYWIRSDSIGTMHLSASSAPKTGSVVSELSVLNKITIAQKTNGSQTLYVGSGSIDADKYQMPPRAPEGILDARFASNRMVEIYPLALDKSMKYDYPILISATQFPLTVRWQAAKGTDEQHTLTLKTEDGKLLAMLNGTGKITLSDASIKKLIVSVNSGADLPKVFSLSRNYPNPFNPTTWFTVAVPRVSQMDVSVFDILGRRIATIWNGEQTAGYHTMEWDGRDGEGIAVPSGIYFIRASVPTEEFSAVQKVMLLK